MKTAQEPSETRRATAAVPVAVVAIDVPPRTRPSNYPEPFRSMMAGRVKRTLGDLFGLTNFGVNLTVLPPGSVSALRHAHATQDEFVYVVSGQAVLCTDEGRTPLAGGMCAGFKAGSGNAHRLVNESDGEVVYLEVGDRSAGDIAVYPDDDLVARFEGGAWVFSHKDGRPYGPSPPPADDGTGQGAALPFDHPLPRRPTMQFHLGRLIDHVHLRAADLDASKRFYRAVLGALGRAATVSETDDHLSADELWIDRADGAVSHVHLAFQASGPEQVRAFHAAALAAGGRDNGAPGERGYHPGYYAAFVLDPDGNNVEAVFHGAADRSADSVVVTPRG